MLLLPMLNVLLVLVRLQQLLLLLSSEKQSISEDGDRSGNLGRQLVVSRDEDTDGTRGTLREGLLGQLSQRPISVEDRLTGDMGTEGKGAGCQRSVLHDDVRLLVLDRLERRFGGTVTLNEELKQ